MREATLREHVQAWFSIRPVRLEEVCVVARSLGDPLARIRMVSGGRFFVIRVFQTSSRNSFTRNGLVATLRFVSDRHVDKLGGKVDASRHTPATTHGRGEGRWAKNRI